MTGNPAEQFFGGGNMGAMGVDPNAALQQLDYSDPNAGIQAFSMPEQGVSQGAYGYDAGLSQGPTSDLFGGQQQMFPQTQPDPMQAYNQMFPQAQPQPQFQPPAPQFQQPQFQQPQFQQPAPQFQQPQAQPPAALTPEQFFGAAQNPQQQPPQGYPQPYQQPQYNPQFQQPQFQQPAPQGYPQPYAQPQYNPQQFQQPAVAPMPGYPTSNFQAPQAYGQPQYPQAQQFGQPNAEPSPTSQFDQQIQQLEEKYAANEVAFQIALQQGDQQTAQNVARERAQTQGQLSAAYVQRGQVEMQYAQQQLAGVQQEYVQGMTGLMQQYFGYQPTPQDVQEFQNILGVIMTPESAGAMRDPMVRDMVLKSYAFDKMSGVRRQSGQRQAPRDYIPNMQAGPALGGNNFGQQPQQMVQPGFAAMSEQQRIGFLSTGPITRPGGR